MPDMQQTKETQKDRQTKPPALDFNQAPTSVGTELPFNSTALYDGNSIETQVSLLQRMPGQNQHALIQRIQQTQGNQHAQQVLQAYHGTSSRTVHTPSVQTKMTVSDPGDAYEQEAEQVAESVMRMTTTSPAPPPTDNPETPGEDQQLQTHRYLQASGGGDLSGNTITSDMEKDVHQSLQGGTPLPKSERDFFEPRLGADLSNVKVHTDTQASKSAQSLQAHAYTVGSDIAFAPGKYEPGSSAGRKLMAHELTHVMQQGGAGKLKKQSVQRSLAVGQDKPTTMVPLPIPPSREQAAEAQQAPAKWGKTSDTLKNAGKDTALDQPQISDKQTLSEEQPTGADKEQLTPDQGVTAEQETQADAASQQETAEATAQSETPEQEQTISEEQAEAPQEQTPSEEQAEEQAAVPEEEAQLEEIGAESESQKDEVQEEDAVQVEEIIAEGEEQQAQNESDLGVAQEETQKSESNLGEAQTELERNAATPVQFAPAPDMTFPPGTVPYVLDYLGVDVATPMKEKQRQDAVAAGQQIDNFIAETSAQATQITTMATAAQQRIRPAAQQAQVAIKASVAENTALIQSTLEQARQQAESEAETARQEITAKYETTLGNLESTTQTARDAIEGDYASKMEALATLESTKSTEIQQAVDDKVQEVQKSGKDNAQSARSIGQEYIAKYSGETYPEPSLLDGSDYYERKRQAKIGAAKQVAEEYAGEFSSQANDAAGQLASGVPDAQSELQVRIAAAREAIENEHSTTIEALETTLQQALESAETTHTQELQTVDTSLESTLESLSALETALITDLEQTGEQQSTSIAQSAEQSLAAIQSAVAQAATSLNGAIQQLASGARGIPTPTPGQVAPLLAQARGQFTDIYANTQAGLQQQIATAETGITSQQEQSLTLVNAFGTRATEESTPIIEDFVLSLQELVQAATNSFTEMETAHTESTDTQVETTLGNFEATYTQAETDADEVIGCLETGLDSFISQFESGFAPALQAERSKIESEATAAANKVQPAWKKAVAFVLTVVITVVVAVAITALVASGVGLLAGLLIAAGIGAVAGIAKGMINNWAEGEEVLKDFWKNAALGALDGMLQFAGGRFVQGLKLPDVGLKKIAVKQAVDAASGFIKDVAALGIDGQLTWENVGKSILNNLVDGVIGFGTGSALEKFGLTKGSLKEVLTDMGLSTLGDTIAGMTKTFVIAGQPFTFKDALNILGESTAKNLIKTATTQGLKKIEFEEALKDKFNKLAETETKTSGTDASESNKPNKENDDLETAEAAKLAAELAEKLAAEADSGQNKTLDTADKNLKGSEIAEQKGYLAAPEGYHWAKNGDGLILKRNPGKATDPNYPPLQYFPETKQFLSMDQVSLIGKSDAQLQQDFSKWLQNKNSLDPNANVYFNPQEDFDPGVYGYYDPTTKKLHINKGMDGWTETALHEGIHMLSDNGMATRPDGSSVLLLGIADGEVSASGKFLGYKHTGLNEGFTELMALETAQRMGVTNFTPAYQGEIAVATALRDVVGNDTLYQMYYASNSDGLRAATDAKLGAGAFDEISIRINYGDKNGALLIINNGMP